MDISVSNIILLATLMSLLRNAESSNVLWLSTENIFPRRTHQNLSVRRIMWKLSEDRLYVFSKFPILGLY